VTLVVEVGDAEAEVLNAGDGGALGEGPTADLDVHPAASAKVSTTTNRKDLTSFSG
jgi:hypothetical protein